MNFKRSFFIVMGICVLSIVGFSNPGFAGQTVPFSFGIQFAAPVPPEVSFSAPPSLVVVPGTKVYVAPNVEGRLLFYHGYWWRPFEGRWYRSDYYYGPWQFVVSERVPGVLYNLPPNSWYTFGRPHFFHRDEFEGNRWGWQHEHHWYRDDRHNRDGHRDWEDRDRNEHRDWQDHEVQNNRRDWDSHYRYRGDWHNRDTHRDWDNR